MCGICGKLSFSQPVAEETVRAMNQRLFHRGPDEEGVYRSLKGQLVMAMRRLKIIDLSTGSQPLFNETGDIAVVFNGEIYNYIELRKDLETKGHRFATHSDTEVIVHAYEAYGHNFLSYLNGMFAIALWDDVKEELVLARDRMGIKPLYWRQDSKGLSFGSEIKSLLADRDCSKEMDLTALDDYFSLLYVPGPNSIFKSIKKLEPAHYLVASAAARSVKKFRYWKRPVLESVKERPWDFYRENLDYLFRDALKLQLRSDVPNGVFLSSGLDSAAIAYYASQVSSNKIKTFTVHFSDESYSEREGARRIAEVCGSEHHEILLEPKVEELVLKTTDFFDEPFADTSAIPTFLLCQSVRRQITVALSGEGGDELFAGYPTYLATQWARRYRHLPGPMRKIFAAVAGRLPVSWDRISWDYKVKQFVYGAQFAPERAHFAWKEIFGEGEKPKLYQPGFLQAKNGHEGFQSFEAAFREAGGGTDLEKLLYVDQNTYLLDQFLVKSDRMSMAHALEVRVPILDHRLVEFAAQIPKRYKLRGTTTKWTLRKLLEGKIPAEILKGSKKGFSPPIPAWIAGELRPFIEENLSETSIKKSGILEPAYVRRLMDEHFSRKRDNHRRLWAVLNFVLWHDRWIGNR